MAEVDESQFSIMSLEDELTCSICLSTFDCPVTIPCGHNFCQDCLLASWEDSYSCPQCRTVFDTKPELKKNTVLIAVVETFKLRSSKSEDNLTAEESEEERGYESEEERGEESEEASEGESEEASEGESEEVSEEEREEESEEESEAEKDDVIRCDTCMEAEASKTCLTCMASYCEEHLRPHRENPVFHLHELSEPVGDLSERICSDHHKLMEFFCSQHDRLICSFCLQHIHKGCSFLTPEEQRNLKESDLRDKLGLLNEKMEKTENVVFQMNNMQSMLKDGANKRKTALAAVYQQMRDILAQDEREAQTEVDRELELGQMKLRDLTKKFDENYNRMGKAREDINRLLSQSQTSAFLQASVVLPKVVKFEPHVPRINLDSKKVIATQSFAAALRETLMAMLKQPVEARLPFFKADLNTGAFGDSGETAAPASRPESAGGSESQPNSAPQQRSNPSFHSPLSSPPIQPYYQPVPIPVFIRPQQRWNPPHYPQAQPRLQHFGQPRFYAQQNTNQDRKPHSAPGGGKPAGKGSDFTKKDKPKGHPPSEKSNPDRRPHSAAGGHKSSGSGKGSDFTKKDKPKGHASSEKSNPDRRPHSAAGGHKSSGSGKGSDFTKKDKPKGHASSGTQHSRPHRNQKK
ncbi:E3 ubiquitin/ISG15 ligase TRIM25-like isoform X2 [Simochromis diagramma]|uniref:E3 ubiquitin/ISG15 ligase TRIM25-like isoform X2 n=1 Tax=Simochromis diagramma TaxID=43689 RepID=UPI001A7E3074|nr:E3 ubiquitin/ISG15 ligase TRIM25-like isoform X2 [Simochromis diagramma]